MYNCFSLSIAVYIFTFVNLLLYTAFLFLFMRPRIVFCAPNGLAFSPLFCFFCVDFSIGVYNNIFTTNWHDLCIWIFFIWIWFASLLTFWPKARVYVEWQAHVWLSRIISNCAPRESCLSKLLYAKRIYFNWFWPIVFTPLSPYVVFVLLHMYISFFLFNYFFGSIGNVKGEWGVRVANDRWMNEN